MKKLVLTGAAGRLGSYLREPLSKLCDQLISTDIVPDIGTLYAGETYIQADIAKFDDVFPILKGADTIIHFGAISDEATFEELLGPNFIGSYNIWESAYRHNVKRVVYASSIHAVGMHPKQDFIGIDAAHRPDTFYGLSKCFSEDLGRMYWEKRQIEAVCLRILSCAQVTSPRALGSWLSYDDLIQLVIRSIDTPTTGFSIIYGVSDNDRATVDNTQARHLGYRPKDNAEQFSAQIFADADAADHQDIAQMCQGGPFAAVDLGESGQAKMKIIDDRKT